MIERARPKPRRSSPRPKPTPKRWSSAAAAWPRTRSPPRSAPRSTELRAPLPTPRPGRRQADRRAQRRRDRRQAGRPGDRAGIGKGGLNAPASLAGERRYCWCWPPAALTPSSAWCAASPLGFAAEIAKADHSDQFVVRIEHRQAADLRFAHPLGDGLTSSVVARADDVVAHQFADAAIGARGPRRRRAPRCRGR